MLAATPWAFYGHLTGQDLVAQQYPNLTGKGYSIAIVDMGIDYNHPVLGGGFGPGHKVEAGWDFASNDPYPFCDVYAHGTAGAGILAGNPYTFNNTFNQGIAPQANLIALRENGYASIQSSFAWILANRAKYNIVAVEFADTGAHAEADYVPQIKALYDAGVFVGAPAGNGGPSQSVYDNPYSFTVGGIGQNDQLTSFSARGAGVDMVGPADHVTVPYYDIPTRQHVITDGALGTSWAAPYVVGAAAIIKQVNPKFTVGQIMSILRDSGHQVYDSVSRRSYARLDLYAAVRLAYTRSGVPVGNPTPVPPTSSPFSGQPIGIAATGTTIQAEDFDKGGEGAGYHDAEAANLLGKYRAEGVDIEATGDVGGGYDVGMVRAGEWLKYTISVPTTGKYDISFRLASNGLGGSFHLEEDGVRKTGSISIINTGGWQKWQTGTVPGVSLTGGTHVLSIVMDTAGPNGYLGNFNWFSVKPVA